MKIRTLTRMAILAAAALILSYLDSLIPLVPSVPGIKLGLSNLVLLYAVFYMTPFETVLLMLLKVGLSSLLFGNAVGALYALAGGFRFPACCFCTAFRRSPRSRSAPRAGSCTSSGRALSAVC